MAFNIYENKRKDRENTEAYLAHVQAEQARQQNQEAVYEGEITEDRQNSKPNGSSLLAFCDAMDKWLKNRNS